MIQPILPTLDLFSSFKIAPRSPFETLSPSTPKVLKALAKAWKDFIEVKEIEEEEKELSDSQEFHSMEETVHSTKENDPERKARVIINDIILYNRNIVEEGRNKKNLYRLLEDTILQAKEEYMRKFNDLSSFESNPESIFCQ